MRDNTSRSIVSSILTNVFLAVHQDIRVYESLYATQDIYNAPIMPTLLGLTPSSRAPVSVRVPPPEPHNQVRVDHWQVEYRTARL